MIDREPTAETATPNAPIVAKAVDVRKTYGAKDAKVEALRGVSLDVRRGDHLAIVGRSGSGKSTFLNLIGALDAPTAGSVEIVGQRTERADKTTLSKLRNTHIGFVFQQYNLFSWMSALANVEAPLIYAGLREAERRDRAMAQLQALGLERRARHRPSELSGGEQQRVAIARALVNEPDLILADEPTGALDEENSERVLDALQAAIAGTKAALIIVTHDLALAGHADAVIRLRDGLIDDG